MIDVSIIIPTINRPLLLERALQSVARQKGSFTHECIVVDDGTTESAGYIRVITENANARYYTTENGGKQGGAVARNVGISVAAGRFIAFLDDDDCWMEDKLQRQLSLMLQNNYQITYTGMHIIGNGGQKRYSFRKPPFSDHYRSIMRRNFIGTTSTVMVSKCALDAAGGFDKHLPALQDYDLYIQLLRTNSVGWLKEPLTAYYTETAQHNVSASRARFFAAVHYLSKKYRNDPCFFLLKRSFVEIFLLKCFRSPRFLSETFRSVVKGGR